MSDLDLAVTLTVEQLRSLVRNEVSAAVSRVADEVVLSRKQAAQLLGCNERLVVKLVKECGLPGHKLGERDWRFMRSEILSWMASQKGAA